jgi:hypothetical protein
MGALSQQVKEAGSMVAAVDAVTDFQALRVELAAAGAGVIALALFAAIAAKSGSFGAFALGYLLFLVCLGTGFNAAGVVLMDGSAGAVPRPFVDALLAGVLAWLKSIVVFLLAGLGVLAVLAAVAVVLWICKIPVIGPILFFFAFPLSALCIGLTFLALGFVLAPVALPALWSGQGVMTAFARVVIAVRKRLLAVLVRGLVLALLLIVSSMLVWFALIGGLFATGAMSVGILRTALDPSALMGVMGGGMRESGHALAGILGAILLLVAVASALSQILKKGWCLIYMQVVRDLDVGRVEAEMQQRLAQVRQHAAAVRDRVQQQNATAHSGQANASAGGKPPPLPSHGES